jgi:cyclophilin family peptidyl-prolyl cis-trans isomerase
MTPSPGVRRPRSTRQPALGALLCLVTALAGAAPARASATKARNSASAPAHARSAMAASGSIAIVETVAGDIAIALDPKAAPKTVANFRKLVANGFYDSLTFHRVVPGFVIQGGDPNSRDENPFNDGDGGPGYTLPAEIQAPHVKGAVAMARKSDAVNPERASSGSQFYIALRDLPNLDGGYTVFGQVVSGWAAIDSIVGLAARTDIARVGNNANPGRLAMIRHARLLPATGAKKKPAKPKPAAVPADSAR